MRTKLLLVLVVAMAALSGCAMLDDTGEVEESGSDEIESSASGESEFSETVTFAWYGVVDEAAAVKVAVENTGDSEGIYEAALTADGDEVASESVAATHRRRHSIFAVRYVFAACDTEGKHLIPVTRETPRQ